MSLRRLFKDKCMPMHTFSLQQWLKRVFGDNWVEKQIFSTGIVELTIKYIIFTLQDCLKLFARLAKDNIGFVDWNPYLATVSNKKTI